MLYSLNVHNVIVSYITIKKETIKQQKDNLIKKWAKNLNCHFSQEEVDRDGGWGFLRPPHPGLATPGRHAQPPFCVQPWAIFEVLSATITSPPMTPMLRPRPTCRVELTTACNLPSLGKSLSLPPLVLAGSPLQRVMLPPGILPSGLSQEPAHSKGSQSGLSRKTRMRSVHG